MPMRYIIRRVNADDLADIKKDVPDLEKRLEKAQEHYRKAIEVVVNHENHITYQFQTRKVGADWTWVCPSVELVAGSEAELFQLTDRFKLPPPSHLAHLR